MFQVALSPPWVTFYRKLDKLFSNDPDIKINFIEDAPGIKLYVDNATKAAALAKLLPATKSFGNVKMPIYVIPANNAVESPSELVKKAFEGNSALSYLKTAETGPLHVEATYAVFKNEVVQFFNDDISDVNGQCSTLYQEIAKEVFPNIIGVYFCTDTPDGESAHGVYTSTGIPDGGD